MNSFTEGDSMDVRQMVVLAEVKFLCKKEQVKIL